MNLPSHIRVGYRDFAIEAWEPLDASGASKFGEMSNMAGVIRVRADLPPQELANTLLHEVIHAAHFIGGIQGGEESEEHTTVILANQLTQVWRDNPDFVAFMSKCLTAAA